MAIDDEENVSRSEPIEEESRAVKDVTGGPALPIDRYHLWAPTICREEDVKQFIAEFRDATAICRWPARVTLIQLRLCLTRSVKPYGISQDVDSIFEVLRVRFGLTSGDAHVPL